MRDKVELIENHCEEITICLPNPWHSFYIARKVAFLLLILIGEVIE